MLKELALKFVDPTHPNSYPNLRRVYRGLRNRLYGPSWVKCPNNLQLDIHNYCNLWMNGKGCIHCNVKPSGGWNLKRGVMPAKMVKYLISEMGRLGCQSVAPYINTEPLLQDPLYTEGYDLCDVCNWTQAAGMHIEIDTNGTLTKYREYLRHPANKQVRITFSANNPGTYEKVMGAPLYWEALHNIEWLLKKRYPGQYIMLYYITNRYNMAELLPWIKKWRGRAHLTLYPLHEVNNIQLESVKTRPKNLSYWDQLTKKISGQVPHQKNRPIDIYPDGHAEVRYFSEYEVCQGSHSFSVAWTGQILHCTDIPYEPYNYGHVYEESNRDLLAVWRRRNLAKIDHPACMACNVRRQDHNKILRKLLKVTVR